MVYILYQITFVLYNGHTVYQKLLPQLLLFALKTGKTLQHEGNVNNKRRL